MGSKKMKKNRKGKKGSKGGGRVTEGRAPLRLPNLDPTLPGPGGAPGMPSLPGRGLPDLSGLN